MAEGGSAEVGRQADGRVERHLAGDEVPHEEPLVRGGAAHEGDPRPVERRVRDVRAVDARDLVAVRPANDPDPAGVAVGEVLPESDGSEAPEKAISGPPPAGRTTTLSARGRERDVCPAERRVEGVAGDEREPPPRRRRRARAGPRMRRGATTFARRSAPPRLGSGARRRPSDRQPAGGARRPSARARHRRARGRAPRERPASASAPAQATQNVDTGWNVKNPAPRPAP